MQSIYSAEPERRLSEWVTLRDWSPPGDSRQQHPLASCRVPQTYEWKLSRRANLLLREFCSVELHRTTCTVGICTRQQFETGCRWPTDAIYFAGTQGQTRRHSNS
jgi:hypothetical protein